VHLVGGARYKREEKRYGGCMHQARHGRLTCLPSTNGQRNMVRDQCGSTLRLCLLRFATLGVLVKIRNYVEGDIVGNRDRC
jgi:hypothetical protein